MSPIPRLHKETSLFNRTKTLSASFKVLADSITSLVEGKETYTDPEGNVVTNTFGTIIKQTANNVLIKATESSKTAAEGGAALITSLINVATEGVQIAASKVNIEGAAIFTGSGRLSQQTLNNTYDAKGTANTATKRSQRIYYRSSVGSAPNAMPTAWVTATGNKYNSTQSSASGWTTKVPPIASDTGENVSKYPYLWTCEQREQLNGNLAYTNVLLDESSTVIDGGRLITGSVTANSLNARNINSSGILTVGSFTNEASASILNSNVESAASARSQTIYKSAAKGTTTMAANTTWVTASGDTQNVWTTTRPTYSQDYPVLFVATQSQTVAQRSTTTCSCTTPVIDKTTTVIDGGNIITNSITADQIDANNLNLSGRLTIGALTPSTKSDILNSNAISSIKDSMSGFTILWNYAEYSSPNAGEAYICAYDPLTNATSDANGWVTFNGTKRTITKQMANPNNILPYNVPIYIVCRLSSASATSGTNYMVWYDSGWKYAAMPTPSAVGGSWTWNNATDIILGKFVEPSNEGQLTECFVFNPPLTSKHVSTDTTTAASANSAASVAQSTANSANTNAASAQSTANSTIKSSIQLWFTKANSTAPSAPTAHVTTNDASSANKWNIAVPTYNAEYPHYFYCYEYLKGNNTYSWSPVVYDRATTESQSTVQATSSSLANYIRTNDQTLASLQSQVDGSVDIWYGSSDPASSTAPWPSDDSKDIHVGDMYVNTTTGKSFRYTKSGNTYAWTEIPDEAASAALSAANSAKTTADKKRRVFTVTPTVPYDVGDLWVNGTQVKYAKTARTTGSYSASDWALTATDDTVASAAKSTAENAASAASSAQTTANTANNKLVSFRGICTTAAGTAAKTVACAGFALTQGYSITVYNTTAQTVGGAITLNVNSLGAKAVWVANAATSDTNRLYWSAGSTVTFVYDGTQFRVADNPGSYLGSTCSVAENNGSKVTSVGDCVIFKGTAVSVPMTYANTATSLTLNVSSTSARNIYYGTSTIVPTKENGFSWLPDSNVIFVFDGKFWKTGNQTFTDGKNLIIGSVSADKLNVNDINAKNSLTIGALSNETRDSILNSNITIGGRNILLNSDTPSKFLKNTPSEYEVARLQIASGQGLVLGQWYTLQIWGYNYNRKSINAYVGGGSYNVASWMEMSSNGDLYVAFTFKATATMVNASQDIRIYASNNNGTQGSTAISGTFDVTKAELERGNKPTDWTSAPEDVDGDIDAAAKTATNYIIYENATDGIKVTYNGTNAATQITSSGVNIINSDNVNVASFGTIARLGESDMTRAEIDYHSMQLINKEGTTYFHVSDLRGSDGTATIRESFIADGNTEYFTVSAYVSQEVSATENSGTSTTITNSGKSYRFRPAPPEGAKVTIRYKTTDEIARAFTFGTRKYSSNVGMCSVSLGMDCTAGANYSYAEGYQTVASGMYAHSEGYYTEASGDEAHAEGSRTTASHTSTHAEGGATSATKPYAHSEGKSTRASAQAAHAEGMVCTASGLGSHAEGYYCTASNQGAHAEGYQTTSSEYSSHSEGYNTKATGEASHAENSGTTSSAYASHAEGLATTSSGFYSHAEGWDASASGRASHAEGYETSAVGDYSHAGGQGTIANGVAQNVVGLYNVASTTHIMIAGNGDADRRKNAMYLNSSGGLWIAGSLTQNSDRRLKTHHAYLGKEACTFMRKLRPALFTKDGERHLGFYAQDVQDAEPENWDTVTVRPDHTDESLDFDPLTLDYTALIAPLTAYAQQLEKRVEYLESTVDSLVEANDEIREMVDNLIGERL